MKNLALFFLLISLLATSANAQKKYVPKRGDYTFRTQVCTSVDEDGDSVVDSIIT